MLLRHEAPVPEGIRFWTNEAGQTVMDDYHAGLRTTWVTENALKPYYNAQVCPTKVFYEPWVNIRIEQEPLP